MIKYWHYTNISGEQSIYSRDYTARKERCIWSDGELFDADEYHWENWACPNMTFERAKYHEYEIKQLTKEETEEIMFLDLL